MCCPPGDFDLWQLRLRSRRWRTLSAMSVLPLKADITKHTGRCPLCANSGSPIMLPANHASKEARRSTRDLAQS